VVREGDTAVLECMSQGSSSARTRVEWVRDGRPVPTDSPRHHLAADSQILIVRQAQLGDAGIYTCVVSNALGSDRAASKLTVIASDGNAVGDAYADGLLSPSGDRYDVTMRIALAMIAGIAGIVLTSFVWVMIIYCLRRRRDSSDSSSSSASTSDTIVAGVGTSSDLSYCTMKLKGSSCGDGSNLSPVSSWIYDSKYISYVVYEYCEVFE
jgi:leucine-rich repeats and immunoglobulin-like domains protein 1/3